MAKRVYQLGFDPNEFQCLFVDSGDAEVVARHELNGSPMSSTWVPPPVYIEFPTHRTPEIWNLPDLHAMVLAPKADGALTNFLLEAELLPLPVGSELFTVVNILEVRNYLDVQQTKLLADIEGGIPEIPEFVTHRIGGPSLFKLPDDNVWMYCWEDDAAPGESFRAAVLDADLSGVAFDEIWNSETGGRRPRSVPGA